MPWCKHATASLRRLYFLPVCSGWSLPLFLHLHVSLSATAHNNVKQRKWCTTCSRTKVNEPHRISIGVSNMLSINKVHNILRKSISILLLLARFGVVVVIYFYIICSILVSIVISIVCVVRLKKKAFILLVLFKRFNKECVRGQCVAQSRSLSIFSNKWSIGPCLLNAHALLGHQCVDSLQLTQSKKRIKERDHFGYTFDRSEENPWKLNIKLNGKSSGIQFLGKTA